MKMQNKQEKSIRFINSRYDELFRIPEGGTIQVTFPDRQFIEKCWYIDDYHTKIGNTVYHICEYAELLERNEGRCKPEPETVLRQAAWQLGHKEYLLIEHTDNGYMYEVVTQEFLSRIQGQISNQPERTMNQAREHILELAALDRKSRMVVPFDMVKQKMEEVLKASEVKSIEWIDSNYYPSVRTAEHTLSCEIRGERVQLYYEVSQHEDGEGFTIHSDGRDIWDWMPEPELRKLEPMLASAVEYGHWKRELSNANTLDAVREVRYGLYETENSNLTKEQIGELHAAIDRKEAGFTAEKKRAGRGR